MVDNWLLNKDACQRCMSGIDDDHDGNCATCAKMSDETAKFMRDTRVRMELGDMMRQRSETIER